MLTKNEIEKIAADYLIERNYPIVIPGRVTLAEDQSEERVRKYFSEKGLSSVSFKSKYLDDPEHELEPGAYVVFVNIITGEVHMPRHMV